jgi:hypothetical protein
MDWSTSNRQSLDLKNDLRIGLKASSEDELLVEALKKKSGLLFPF